MMMKLEPRRRALRVIDRADVVVDPRDVSETRSLYLSKQHHVNSHMLSIRFTASFHASSRTLFSNRFDGAIHKTLNLPSIAYVCAVIHAIAWHPMHKYPSDISTEPVFGKDTRPHELNTSEGLPSSVG